jgi:hypothetical protein
MLKWYRVTFQYTYTCNDQLRVTGTSITLRALKKKGGEVLPLSLLIGQDQALTTQN